VGADWTLDDFLRAAGGVDKKVRARALLHHCTTAPLYHSHSVCSAKYVYTRILLYTAYDDILYTVACVHCDLGPGTVTHTITHIVHRGVHVSWS
jgi:hypothetical protein